MGGLAVLGAPAASSLTPTRWSDQAQVKASDGAASDEFGSSVAVSGTTAVVGAPTDSTAAGPSAGSVDVYVRAGSAWTQQAHLVASDGAFGDEFGYSVAVAGNILVVGAPFHQTTAGTNAGSAYVFVRSGTTWTEQQHLFSTQRSAFFGWSVALAGTTTVVGAPGDDFNTGSAYAYLQSGTTWTLQRRLVANVPQPDDRFGWSVAISGNTAVIGAPFDDNISGSAYVFYRAGTNWTLQQQLFASDAGANDRFGSAVAASGNTVVIGAPFDNNQVGSAYVYLRTGATWAEQQHLFASDDLETHQFGWSVGLDTNTTVVGSPGDNNGGAAGSVSMFGRSGTTWTQQARLSKPDITQSLGSAVAISGVNIVAGAPHESTFGGHDAGTASVFVGA